MNTPHGEKLMNRYKSKAELDLDNIDLKVTLDSDQIYEIINIADGVYSPLTGYLGQDDVTSVLEKMRLLTGIPWTVPIVLPVDEGSAKKVKAGSQIVLLNQSKEEVGVLILDSKFKLDKTQFSKKVYGTTDKKHPGVAMVLQWENHCLAGNIWVFQKPKKNFRNFDKSPKETRKLFQKNGWKTIVGFQTRNPAHMAHEYIQKLCLEFVDGLFINPIVGKKKEGDFKDDVILSVYEMLVEQFYPKNSTMIGTYKSRMYYAGPREAVFHAIVRKNYGCTHFIVGRDHAGVGDYYDRFAAHKIFDELEDIGIEVMKVSGAFFDRRMKMFATEKTSPFSEIYRVSPSGTQIRQFIRDKNYESLRKVMRDEVLDIIFSFENPFVS